LALKANAAPPKRIERMSTHSPQEKSGLWANLRTLRYGSSDHFGECPASTSVDLVPPGRNEYEESSTSRFDDGATVLRQQLAGRDKRALRGPSSTRARRLALVDHRRGPARLLQPGNAEASFARKRRARSKKKNRGLRAHAASREWTMFWFAL